MRQAPQKPPLLKRIWPLEEMSKVWLVTPPLILTLTAVVLVLIKRFVLHCGQFLIHVEEFVCQTGYEMQKSHRDKEDNQSL